MSIRKPFRPVLVALVAAASLAGGAAAWATSLPPVHQQGAVTYMSGGVDTDTAARLQAASKDWPAMLEFAVKDSPVNAYLANVQVQVVDGKGSTVLKAVSQGPFMLVRLEPGRYEVKATFAGKTLDGTVHVQAGQHAREVFMWPAEYLKKAG